MRQMLNRRDWLRMASLGCAGASLSGWVERFAQAAATQPAQEVVHPVVDERRPVANGHVRRQAWPQERRPHPGDRHGRPRRQDQRTSAETRETDEAHGHYSLDEDEGSRPLARHVFACAPADRRAGHPVSHARLAGVQGTAVPGRSAARLREHRAGARPQRGGLLAWLPRSAAMRRSSSARAVAAWRAATPSGGRCAWRTSICRTT